MLSRPGGLFSRNDKPPDIWNTHGFSWNVFVNPPASSSSPHPEGFNPWISNVTEDTWPRHNFGSEMPVRTVSQKFIRPSRGKIFKGLWSRPTTTADLRSSFWQIPYSNNICLLEDKIQNWGIYLFAISYGSDAMDQRSGVGWFSGWSKIFVFCKRNSNAKFWSTRWEDCFSTEPNHPSYPRVLRNVSAMIAEREALRMGIEHLTVLFPTEVRSFDFQVENSGRTVQVQTWCAVSASLRSSQWCDRRASRRCDSSPKQTKRKVSLEEQKKHKKRIFFSVEDRSLTWSTSTSGSLEPMILSRIMPTYLHLIFEMMIVRNSIRNGTEFYCLWRKSHLMTSGKDCTN